MRQMEGIRVSTVFTMELEAGSEPEICLPGVTAETLGSLHWQFDPAED